MKTCKQFVVCVCVSLLPQELISLTRWQCRTRRCLRHPWERGLPLPWTIRSRWTWAPSQRWDLCPRPPGIIQSAGINCICVLFKWIKCKFVSLITGFPPPFFFAKVHNLLLQWWAFWSHCYALCFWKWSTFKCFGPVLQNHIAAILNKKQKTDSSCTAWDSHTVSNWLVHVVFSTIHRWTCHRQGCRRLKGWWAATVTTWSLRRPTRASSCSRTSLPELRVERWMWM